MEIARRKNKKEFIEAIEEQEEFAKETLKSCLKVDEKLLMIHKLWTLFKRRFKC